ncbi:type II secretion system F family protein [Thermaerobacter litoralis]
MTATGSALACAVSAALAGWLVTVAWPELGQAVGRRRRASADDPGGAKGVTGSSRRGRRPIPMLALAGFGPGPRRRQRAGRDGAAEALEGLLVTVIAHLQAGRPLRQAWIEAARETTSPALEPAKGAFLAAMGAGLSLEEALALWHRATGLRALRRCQAVAAAHRRTGGDVTGPMLAIIHRLREQRLGWADLAARTAEARLSARLLAVLPAAVTGYALLMDPAFLTPLWDDPLGRWGLGYGVVSWFSGLYLLGRLTGRLAAAGEG